MFVFESSFARFVFSLSLFFNFLIKTNQVDSSVRWSGLIIIGKGDLSATESTLMA